MLGEGGKFAPAQGHEWDSWGEDGYFIGTACERGEVKRLEVEMKGERIVPNFCFSFAEPAVRMKRSSTRRKAQKLMNVTLRIFFHAK